MKEIEAKLEAVFNDIAQTRMAGVPICNSALRVQVVGLREWQGRWVGVLITPWTISLVLMPGTDAPLPVLGMEEKKAWDFPSGKYEFFGLNEPSLGTCQVCSLISPVIDYVNQEDAVKVAGQVMEALFVPAKVEPRHDEDRAEMLKNAQPMVEPGLKKQLSRRDFLRGAFLEK
jgi:[NiFe] hydrogenase assembly HybE family chaperone